MKTFFRKYLLIVLYCIMVYAVILCGLLFYTNPFPYFFNISLGVILLYAYALRLVDDYKDYAKDKLKGKALLSRRWLITLFYICIIAMVIIIILFKKWMYLIPLGVLGILFIIDSKWIKICILPTLTFCLIYSEFSFHFTNLFIFSGCLGIGILYALKKNKIIFTVEEIGGKAYTLYKLKIKNTPKYIVIPVQVIMEEDISKIELYIQSFCKKKKKYAVRSSAIEEDSNSCSFAGIYESYLNVNYSNLLEAVLKVKASANSLLASSYRCLHHLKENRGIAVIIQEMVDADYAGVMNTINPVTNNISEIVISIKEGLGNQLVDGTVDGTTYFVNGRNIKVEGEDVLPRTLLKKLVILAKQIGCKTHTFQDIEFAIKKRHIYFLQARPIATYQGINSHKMTLLLDNSNIIESYYGITSPLTFSFAKEVYEKVYKETLKIGKVRKKIMKTLEPSLKNMLYYYEGKIYYNLNSWYHVASIFPSKNSLQYMESMMGVKDSNVNAKKLQLNAFDMIKIGIIFLNKLKHMDQITKSFINNFNQIVLPYYGKELYYSNEELITIYHSLEDQIIPEFAKPILNDCAVMFYFGRLKEKVKKYPNADTLLNQCISNHGNVASAASASHLKELIEIVHKDETIYQDFSSLSSEELLKKYNKKTMLGEKLWTYIYNFGSRVMDELKLETITMIENPTILIELIRMGLSQEQENSFQLEFQQEIPKNLQRLSCKTKKYIQNREELRLKRTIIYSVVRNIFLAFGRNYVKEGKLNQVRDIFYLTKEEVLNDDPQMIEKVRSRKKEIEQYKNLPIYDRISFFDDKCLPVLHQNSLEGLRGIPSGTGCIKAKVTLMNSKDDFLEKGNIILTKRTDPGWISLFPLASGLIVEHGSMLSHSFVVARELGLPAVVGVKDATRIIHNGETVFLDGVEGVVQIEDKKTL